MKIILFVIRVFTTASGGALIGAAIAHHAGAAMQIFRVTVACLLFAVAELLREPREPVQKTPPPKTAPPP